MKRVSYGERWAMVFSGGKVQLLDTPANEPHGVLWVGEGTLILRVEILAAKAKKGKGRK